jgi:hypothetical protein
MEKRPNLLSRIWSKVTNADTWSWLFSLLPKPVRQWLRDNLWRPILTALLTGGALLWGLITGIPLFWLAIATLDVLVFSFWGTVQVQSAVERFKARRRAFKVRAVSGSMSGTHFVPAGTDPFAPAVVYARLEVEATRFLRNCSATVTRVKGLNIVKGKIKGKDKTVRSWHALFGFPREIGWQENGRTRDLVPDVPRSLDVAVLDQADQTKFAIVAADGHRVELPPGWYKVEIKLVSESDDYAVQIVEMVIEFHPREPVPAPLQALPWKDEYEHSLGGKG